MNVIRECSNPDCLFRYPEVDSKNSKAYCPKCGQVANIAVELPEKETDKTEIEHNKGLKSDFKVVLDNIRSIYNVGSVFRTSDGFGVNEIILCGITPTPNNPRFSKTSLGAEDFVDWIYKSNALITCKDLQKKGYQVISLEKTECSTNLYAITENIVSNPIALVIGNEKTGIDPEILRMSDLTISIPMNGFKNSYNVSTSFGIAVSYFYALSTR